MPVLDTGARGSTVTFVERGIGDVLLAWENEAFLALKEFGADKFEIVVPSESILAEPPVAVVDKVVDAKGTRKVAEAYLQFLYSPEAPGDRGQEFLSSAPRRGGRRSTRTPSRRSRSCTIDDEFGGWGKAQKTHFAEGGIFDQIYKPGN